MIGYRSTVINGVRWRENQGGLFPLSPPNMLANVCKKNAQDFLRKEKSLFVRWENEFDQDIPTPWWHIIKDAPEDLEQLPKKTRYMIRKASKNYEAKPIELKDVLEQGYPVYVKAYERYDTHEPMFTENQFCEAVRNLPEQTEWWGCFDRETGYLVAFSENYVESETCFYVTMWLEPDAMAKFSGYLLFHEMEIHYLHDRGFQYISDGARSLSHHTNIHDFLIRKFNFHKSYARLHVVYVPWLFLSVSAAYPFRNLIKKIPWSPCQKASILLKQEEIRRKCAQVIV